MKRLDPLVIDVDEADVVEVLQAKVRRIVVDAAALVTAHHVEEALVSGAVEKIFAGMQLEADIDTELVMQIEDRLPSPRQFLEGCADELGRPWRPWVEERPGKRS